MRVVPTELPEVLVIEPQVFADARGSFVEVWREEAYAAVGIVGPFVQDNVSRSLRHTLRGLHFQEPRAQGKLIQALEGTIVDVAVDVRQGSPTFGRWVARELTGERATQLWVPPGFAHGFCVLSESALVLYKCTERHAPESEHAVAWNDPALAIRWPVASPVVSPRDTTAPTLAEAPVLPRWSPGQ